MKPTHTLCCVWVMVAVTASQQQGVFHGSTDAVLVDVSVRDGKRSVSDLKRDDFRLLDDSRLQEIVDSTNEVMPLDVTVLIDASESARLLFGDSLLRAGDRVRNLFRPLDRVEILVFGARIVDVREWTGEPLGSWTAGAMFGDRGTAVFDAVALVAMRRPAVGFRRLVILLTDAKDSVSVIDHSTLLSIVKRGDAVVDVVAAASVAVGVHGHLTTEAQMSLSHTADTVVRVRDFGTLLGRVSDITGGYYFDLNQNSRFIEALSTSVNEFRSRYVLRYIPTGVPAGGWHELAVSVPGHKYQVVARRGYFR